MIRGGDTEHMTFSGNWIEGRREEIDKARKQAHGDFLWFARDGKSYFVDDPATLAQIEAMYKPMEALGKQQEELGKTAGRTLANSRKRWASSRRRPVCRRPT